MMPSPLSPLPAKIICYFTKHSSGRGDRGEGISPTFRKDFKILIKHHTEGIKLLLTGFNIT